MNFLWDFRGVYVKSFRQLNKRFIYLTVLRPGARHAKILNPSGRISDHGAMICRSTWPKLTLCKLLDLIIDRFYRYFFIAVKIQDCQVASLSPLCQQSFTWPTVSSDATPEHATWMPSWPSSRRRSGSRLRRLTAGSDQTLFRWASFRGFSDFRTSWRWEL